MLPIHSYCIQFNLLQIKAIVSCQAVPTNNFGGFMPHKILEEGEINKCTIRDEKRPILYSGNCRLTTIMMVKSEIHPVPISYPQPSLIDLGTRLI
jgi:hypothetical protein